MERTSIDEIKDPAKFDTTALRQELGAADLHFAKLLTAKQTYVTVSNWDPADLYFVK